MHGSTIEYTKYDVTRALQVQSTATSIAFGVQRPQSGRPTVLFYINIYLHKNGIQFARNVDEHGVHAPNAYIADKNAYSKEL
jgi:hypothetical protein